MKTIPTKININGEEIENSFHLVLDLDQNFIPFLKDFSTGYRFDISILFLTEILKKKQKRLFNKYHSIVFENNVIVDVVEENSEEAKKIIKNSLLKIKDIPQGSKIKTYSGRELIFIKKIYVTRTNYFLNFIKIFNSINFHKAFNYSINMDKKKLFSKFSKYNIFIVPGTLNIIFIKDDDINFKIEEIYDVVNEFNELNYNFIPDIFRHNYLGLFDCLERTIQSKHPFNRYHHLFNSKIFIFNSNELNYLEKKCKEEINKIIEKDELEKEKRKHSYEEDDDLPF